MCLKPLRSIQSYQSGLSRYDPKPVRGPVFGAKTEMLGMTLS